MRPTDVRRRLNRLAEYAPSGSKLQRVLENVDLVAQEALDAESTYVNKKGDAVTVEAPQWAVVLNATKLAAQLLGLEPGEQKDGERPESTIERMQREIRDAGGDKRAS